ncbi:hypothetical protein MLD63_06980 [Paracoccus sp. TK19116]|uniref:Uncharacterized protein n=1 Tax=Paracoccus albicereus TaxID=2922394 RepID=A0ABT1MRL9_9RHOB|nr:hypothetical protein [Paracoccus albicereus]MCQ0970161.1 hypothetical protein [Paracoccus albicereus]
MEDDFTANRKTGRARGYIVGYSPQAKSLALLDQAQAVLDEFPENALQPKEC